MADNEKLAEYQERYPSFRFVHCENKECTLPVCLSTPEAFFGCRHCKKVYCLFCGEKKFPAPWDEDEEGEEYEEDRCWECIRS